MLIIIINMYIYKDFVFMQNARSVFFHEENQTDQRELKTDVNTHKAACEEVCRIMAQMKKLKEAGPDASVSRILFFF